MWKALTCLAASAVMFVSAALAESPSGGLEDVAKFEVLPGWRAADGTRMVALRVVLAPGWKTYWRAPGDAGIPARFDWEGSGNLKSVRFHWPTPVVFDQNGMRSIGYKDELVLPIELTPKQVGQPITLNTKLEIGVCYDICVPVSARIAATIDGAGAPDKRIRSAMESRPGTPREAGMRSISCSVDPISDGVRLTAEIVLPRLGPDEFAVFEVPDQSIWVAQAETKRGGDTLRAVTELVPPGNRPFLLDRSQVRITILSAGGAVDIQGCGAG